MRLRLAVAALFSCFLFGSIARGQAIVTGTVVSGNRFKPVAGAEVHLVNKTFKPPIDRKVLTGADGSYNFEDVAPGENYAVDVLDPTGKLVGTDKRFAVLPSTTEHTAVPEIDISRGVTAERAEQSGGLIENDRSVSPGANISNEQLRVLPLYNRNFLALGLIQPGVHDVEQGSPLQGAAFSIAGSRSTSTNFLLDGVDNVASSNNQAIPFQVNEAVREFRVTYATPSMRYGQGSGGIVDVITSSGDVGSGGKAFHGSLFGYFNSDALNASQPLSVYSNTGFARASAYANNVNSGNSPSISSVVFADSSPGAATPSNCNFVPTGTSIFCGYSPQSYNALFNLLGNGSTLDPGCKTAVCMAGLFNPATPQDSRVQPINSKQFGGSLGGPIGRNRYLFASYEGTLIDNPTPIFERVPTGLDTTNLPSLSTLETNDAAVAQATLRLFPAPNVGQTGATVMTGTGTGVMGFYRGQAPNYTHVHTVQVRPDLSLNTLGTASFRYTGQLLDQLHDDTLPAGGSYPGNGADRRAQNQSAALTYNFPFRQNRNLLNIAFTQYRVDEVAQDRGFTGNPLNVTTGAMPTIVLAGIDPQTTATTKGGQGAMGGWYDSFWNTKCASGLPVCSGVNSASRSPSPITPSLDGDFPFARLGAPLSAPSKRRDTEAFLSDALDLQLGKRNVLTVGGEYRYQQNFSYDSGMARGLVVTNNIGEFTSDSETCVSCTPRSAFSHPSFDYELRQPSGYTGDLRSSSFGAFAENKFQPTDHMTLLAGLRYDYFGQQLDTANRLWNYSAANYGLNRQSATGTFDPFDYQCGGGTTFFDAVYGSLRASTPTGKWSCNAGGTFQLPQNKHDIAGLLGISYSPDGSYRQVLRASVGAYYDHLPASYNEKLLLNRPTPYNATSPSAIYGQNFASSYSSGNCQVATSCAFGLSTLNLSNVSSSFENYQAASSASILYERDPNALKTPLLVQFSTSYQYRFSGSWTGELNYTGSIGQRLPLVYDSNFANEFYCSNVNGVCNNNTYFPVFTESNIGASNYNSIIARVEGRLWHGLSMHASYTFSKSLDDIAGSDFPTTTDSLFPQLFGRQLYGLGNPAVFALQASSAGYGSNGGLRGTELASSSFGTKNSNLLQSVNIPSFDAIQSALTTTGSRTVNVSRYNLPQNPLAFSSSGNPSGADYGRSDFDVRQRGVADFVYNLPDYGHRWIHGFTVTGITTVQSGQPFTIFSGPAYGQVTQLANVSANIPLRTTGNPNAYVAGATTSNLPSLNNPSCPNLYAQPTLYTSSSTPAACVGNSGRNSFTGPAYFSQDMAFQKATFLRGGEGQALTLRAEFYNIFNRANYYNPISEISTDGVHINPEFGIVRSAHDPFQLQLAVRYDF